MAIFIPDNPLDFNESLGEEEVFESLRALDDDFYVFHSLKWINRGCSSSHRSQGECDFVILHKTRGLIALEVKSGIISCESRCWFQENRKTGVKREILDPAEQANRNKFFLIDVLRNAIPTNQFCLATHAVWFPSVDFDCQSLPLNYSREIILDQSSLSNPQDHLERVLSYWESHIRKSQLTGRAIDSILRTISPNLYMVPTLLAEFENREKQFIKLTSQQASVIDFLDDQKEAVIGGSAGTGKTIVALEKARRLGEDSGQVVFLCYNTLLRTYLREFYPLRNVDFHTFHSLAATELRSEFSLNEIPEHFLNLLSDENYELPYQHVIIDEGQDFEDEWVEWIHLKTRGAFYVFFDKNQLIFRDALPTWVSEAECRLVLKRNCRNTLQIARTSYRIVGSDPLSYKMSVIGDKTFLHDCCAGSSVEQEVMMLLKGLLNSNFKPNDIAILTMKTVESSQLSHLGSPHGIPFTDGILDGHFTFTTVRRFKGLESKIVILIDVDLSSFPDENWRRRMYIGCSRARHELHILINDANNDSFRIALAHIASFKGIAANMRSFAKFLDAKWHRRSDHVKDTG